MTYIEIIAQAINEIRIELGEKFNLDKINHASWNVILIYPEQNYAGLR